MRDDILRDFGRRLRFGMVGGGTDSLIGETHRYAARIDNRFELVAGCLSVDPNIGRNSAALCLIPPERCYTDYRHMAEAEAARPDGIEVVTVCTPPHLHAEICTLFLDHGMHVICEKPMTKTHAEAVALKESVHHSDREFMLTHCYTGYPMVREARALIASGRLGQIRLIETDFVAGSFLTEEPERDRRHWRFRPEFMSEAAILGEIGTHAIHMASYITGLALREVSATMTTRTDRRETYDDVQAQLRFDGGATGRLWLSFVAAGNEHGMGFRIYGRDGSLIWRQERPEQLWLQRDGAPPELLTPGHDWMTPEGRHACRLREGHPEGYVLAFANLYRDFADVVMARSLGVDPDPLACCYPTVEEGVATMRFYEATETSNAASGAWTPVGGVGSA